MKRLAGGVGLLVLGVLVLGAGAADDPSIKEIMTKAHKGGDALLARVGKQLKAEEPSWDDLAGHAQELVKLGTALGKADPPRGEKANWDKVTKAYVANAKALQSAIEKKDKASAAASHKKLTGSCAGCHKQHKPS